MPHNIERMALSHTFFYVDSTQMGRNLTNYADVSISRSKKGSHIHMHINIFI